MNFLSTKSQKNAIPPQNRCSKEIYYFIYERLEATYFPLGTLEKFVTLELDFIICWPRFKFMQIVES